MQKLLLLVLIMCSGMTFISHANMDAERTRGMLVTATGDTLRGDLINFQTSLRSSRPVVIEQADGKEMELATGLIRMVHADGAIYTSVKDKNGYTLAAQP